MDEFNVIFLDFDGVLVTPDSMRKPRLRSDGEFDFHAPAVDALNWLVRKTSSKIVVCSEWRHGTELSNLTSILRSRGVETDAWGVTPCPEIEFSRPETWPTRGDEVAQWLAMPQHVGVKGFVVLDDEDEYEGHREIRQRLVRTNFNSGLTMDDARAAARVIEVGRNVL